MFLSRLYPFGERNWWPFHKLMVLLNLLQWMVSCYLEPIVWFCLFFLLLFLAVYSVLSLLHLLPSWLHYLLGWCIVYIFACCVYYFIKLFPVFHSPGEWGSLQCFNRCFLFYFSIYVVATICYWPYSCSGPLLLSFLVCSILFALLLHFVYALLGSFTLVWVQGKALVTAVPCPAFMMFASSFPFVHYFSGSFLICRSRCPCCCLVFCHCFNEVHALCHYCFFCCSWTSVSRCVTCWMYLLCSFLSCFTCASMASM